MAQGNFWDFFLSGGRQQPSFDGSKPSFGSSNFVGPMPPSPDRQASFMWGGRGQQSIDAPINSQREADEWYGRLLERRAAHQDQQRQQQRNSAPSRTTPVSQLLEGSTRVVTPTGASFDIPPHMQDLWRRYEAIGGRASDIRPGIGWQDIQNRITTHESNRSHQELQRPTMQSLADQLRQVGVRPTTWRSRPTGDGYVTRDNVSNPVYADMLKQYPAILAAYEQGRQIDNDFIRSMTEEAGRSFRQGGINQTNRDVANITASTAGMPQRMETFREMLSNLTKDGTVDVQTAIRHLTEMGLNPNAPTAAAPTTTPNQPGPGAAAPRPNTATRPTGPGEVYSGDYAFQANTPEELNRQLQQLRSGQTGGEDKPDGKPTGPLAALFEKAFKDIDLIHQTSINKGGSDLTDEAISEYVTQLRRSPLWSTENWPTIRAELIRRFGDQRMDRWLTQTVMPWSTTNHAESIRAIDELRRRTENDPTGFSWSDLGGNISRGAVRGAGMGTAGGLFLGAPWLGAGAGGAFGALGGAAGSLLRPAFQSFFGTAPKY